MVPPILKQADALFASNIVEFIMRWSAEGRKLGLQEKNHVGVVRAISLRSTQFFSSTFCRCRCFQLRAWEVVGFFLRQVVGTTLAALKRASHSKLYEYDLLTRAHNSLCHAFIAGYIAICTVQALCNGESGFPDLQSRRMCSQRMLPCTPLPSGLLKCVCLADISE